MHEVPLYRVAPDSRKQKRQMVAVFLPSPFPHRPWGCLPRPPLLLGNLGRKKERPP